MSNKVGSLENETALGCRNRTFIVNHFQAHLQFMLAECTLKERIDLFSTFLKEKI